VSEKLGVKPGMRCAVLHVPQSLEQRADLFPGRPAKALRGSFDYIHFFTIRQATLTKRLPGLKRHLRRSGRLWVSWPKAGGLSTDLSLGSVIKAAYDAGLVESKTISIDATWSAIKLTYPRKDVVYRNSYGRLPDSIDRKNAT
jgi:hypothetical protein